MPRLLPALLCLLLAVTALPARAELTDAQQAALEEARDLRVFASDGAFVGVTNGISVQDGRVRLFIVPRQGSIFRFSGGKDVVVTTLPRKLTQRSTDLILNADTTRLRIKASGSFTDDSAPLTILLLSP